MIRSNMGKLSQKLAPEGQMDNKTLVLLAISLLIITAPLELSQVAFALVGAVAYALIQGMSAPPRKLASSSKAALSSAPRRASAGPAATRPQQQQQQQVPPSAPASRTEFRQPSSQPVAPLRLRASAWDAQVDELVKQIAPTAEGDKVVRQLADFVKQNLRNIVPEIEVTGFASGDLLRGTAFGVAVPEVDIVVSATPQVLAARLQGRNSAAGPSKLDMQKLQKSAIRACTDRLVSSGNFKFRRSAFRGQEPKVTLLVPASLGIHSESIPIDFSVNSTTPLYNAALLTECGHMEPRAKALILLVKRWAKDRGICHAAKGHLSPYTWTLLTIYFLQVGVTGEGPLLPPLEDFEFSSNLVKGQQPKASGKPKWSPRATDGPKKSVGALFKEFMAFYTQSFDFRNEAVSVRLGQRAAPDLNLPLHVVVDEDGLSTKVAPSVEDPFDHRRNLGDCATAVSLVRLHEELARAVELCKNDTALTELLEPWVPPERGTAEPAEEAEDKEVRAPATRARMPPPSQLPWRSAAAARR